MAPSSPKQVHYVQIADGWQITVPVGTGNRGFIGDARHQVRRSRHRIFDVGMSCRHCVHATLTKITYRRFPPTRDQGRTHDDIPCFVGAEMSILWIRQNVPLHCIQVVVQQEIFFSHLGFCGGKVSMKCLARTCFWRFMRPTLMPLSGFVCFSRGFGYKVGDIAHSRQLMRA